MAKQQDPLRSIYNDLGLEQAGIAYDKFSTKFMSDSNARRSVYNDLGLEQAGVGYDLFEERLGVKKKGLSQSASQSGLGTSGQPSAPSPELEASNAAYAAEADNRLAAQGQRRQEALARSNDSYARLADDRAASGYAPYETEGGWSDGINRPNIAGTFREGLSGDWFYTADNYETYVPTPDVIQNVGGYDNLREFFRKNHPDVLLTNPETGQVENFGAKPVDIELSNAIEQKTSELQSKPFEEWDEDDSLGWFVSNMEQLNAGKTRWTEDQKKAARAQQRGERDAVRDENVGFVYQTLDKVSDLIDGAGSGGASFLAGMLGTPEFLWDGIKSTGAPIPSYRDTFGSDELLLKGRDYLMGAVDREALYRSVRDENKGIWESFKEGNIDAGIRMTANAIGQSVPYMASMMFGGGGVMNAYLSTAAGRYHEEQMNNPEKDLGAMMLNANLWALAEIVPERIGMGAMLEPYKRLAKSAGFDVASDALSKSFRQAVGRANVLTPHAIEMSTEMATTILQNAIDGNPLLQGWEDTIIVSGAMSTSITGPGQIGNAIYDNKVLNDVNKLARSNAELEVTLADPELAPEVREAATEHYLENVEKINSYIEEQLDKKGRLSSAQKELVNDLEARKQRMSVLLDSDRVPDAVKEEVQADIDAINEEITDIVEQSAERQAEVDEAIAAFQEANPEIEVDYLEDLPESVVTTFERVESGLPTDPTAIDEASTWMYNKYQELTDLKNDPNRRLTIEQIEGIQEQLGEDITLLENYKLEQYGERAESTQVQPETAADPIADEATQETSEERGSEAVGQPEAAADGITPETGEVVSQPPADAPTASPVVVEESSSQPGQYFTRDVGGEQTVYRRNEDGTASIVPDSEAQTILSQQPEGGQDAVQIGETETLPVDEASALPKSEAPTTERSVSKAVVDVTVSEIQTDEASFQNRDSLDESRVQDIVDNFNEAALDPIVLYDDNGKTVVLSGHHRLAAAQKMGMETIPSRFFEGTKQEAIDFARDSNTLSRGETSTERASRYRDMRSRGEKEASIREKARVAHGSDATKIINLSHLSESGKALEAINSFSESTDVDTKNKVEAIGDWIGNVKSRHPDLSTRQENEMFDYLMDKYGTKKKSGSVTSRSQFFDVANALINRLKDKGAFNEDAVLNLNNAAGKTGIELEYDQALSDAKDAVNDARKALDDVRKRAVAEGVESERMSELLSPLENNLRNALADEQAVRESKGLMQDAVKAQTSIFDVIQENETEISNDAAVEQEVQGAFETDGRSDSETSRSGQETQTQEVNETTPQQEAAPKRGKDVARKKPRTPKTLLKGIVDRLKKSGLARSVELMNSQQIADDLTGRANVQFQASAWHGSPHVFDKFSTSAIGSGEGAQAFGWGLYFTDLESIARGYAEQLANYTIKINGKELGVNHPLTGYDTFVVKHKGDSIKILKELEALQREDAPYIVKGKNDATYVRRGKAIDFLKTSPQIEVEGDRNLYKVTLHKGKTPITSAEYRAVGPLVIHRDVSKAKGERGSKEPLMRFDTHEEAVAWLEAEDAKAEYTWLEWDKPLNKQRAKELISKLTENQREQAFGYGLSGITTEGEFYKKLANALGGNLRGGDKNASLFLLENGIDGVKYPAESISRGATSDNARGFNYVVFDENAVEIEERIRFQNSAENINGYVDSNGRVVINQDTAGIDTPIHEFAHLWEEKVAQDNPALHARGMELIQGKDGKSYVDHVRKTQPGLKGDALYKEALAQAIGDRGARLIDSKRGSRIKEWLNDVWDYISGLVGISGMTADQVSNLTLNEFADAVAVDLLAGKPVNTLPNGDIVVATEAVSRAEMSESEKRVSDFMERMRNKNNIRFQGEIDSESDALSQADLVEFMTVAGDLARLDRIKSLPDLKAFANSIGITNTGDINAAWSAAQDFVGNPRSTSAFKKADMRKEFAGAPFEKMSDAEYIEIGKRMVEEGFIDPDAMAADIIENPRVLQTHETPAMTYGKRRLENRIADNRAALKKDPTNVDLRIEADALWSLMKDYDLATAITAYHWGKSGRLRDLTLDKEYTQVQALAEMEKHGEVSAETRARLEDLGRQLNEAKADLINKAKEIEALKEAQGQAGINSTARSKPVNRPRTNKATRQAAVEVLDGLDLSRFGVASPNFQTNGVVRFSVTANGRLSEALGTAVATMRAQVESGKVRIEEAVETAINAVNSEVGENGWNPVAFRSEIINAYSEKGYVAKPSKPYVGRDGKPVVPGEYLTGLVSAHRSETGTDMTLDQMVEAAQADLGPSFSERDIRDSISGYGRASANRLSDDRKNINTAKTIGRLQSRLEDLQNLGYSPNSRQARARQVTEEIKDIRKAIQDLIDSLEDSPDYKSQMSQALENKKKYIEEYIKEVERRIKTYQDANARGEQVPEGYFSKKPKHDFTSDPDIIALERKREEARNKLKEEVFRHRLANRGTLERAVDVTEQVLFNTTRMLTAGADLSAVLVQGGFITMSDPAMSYRAFKNSVSKAGNKDLYEAYYLDLQNQPLFEAARKAKLNMQLPSFYESIQEEQFGRQNPITHAWDYIMDKTFGKDSKAAKKAKDGFPYAAAERQYAMYLTEIRFEMFNKAVNDAINHFGIDVNSEVGQQKLQTIASGVNDLTMASNIRGLDPGSLPARIGNILLFSMRKLAASWKLMLKMPYYAGAYTLNKGAKYAGAMGITNAARLKNQTDMSAFMFQKMYGKYGGTAMGTVAAITLIPTLIANGIYDPEDEEEEMPKMYNPNVLNPVHSDFMKLKWGNTRIDLTLGIGGNTVLASRLISGGYMTSSSPVFREFDQSVAGFRNSGAWDIFTQYAKNKLAPTPSIAFNKVFGTDFEKAQAGDRITESLYPMWLSGTIDQYQDTGEIGSTIGLFGLSMLGLANNTYGGVEFADHRGTDNAEARRIFESLLISDSTPTRRAKQMYSPSDEGTAQLQDSGFLEGYQGDYNEYMTQATISRKPIITNKRLHPEKVNSLVNNIKSRANKYAEVKSTGIYLDEDFRKVTNRKNETFKLTNAQISQKANILIRTMGSEKFQRFMPQLRKSAEKNMKADGLNPTKDMIEMEAFLNLYNSAHAEASRQMTLIVNKGKMTLVPEDEYNSRSDVKGEYDE